MTLFETLPQLTLFVLFFMLGFGSRFFASCLRFASEILCRGIEKKLLQPKTIKSKNEKTKKVNVKSGKAIKHIFLSKLRLPKFDIKKIVLKMFVLAKGAVECIFEALFFVLLGIATLAIFNLFKFVDFFWFIPLSVICGVVLEEYLTKEVFAKREKM